MRLANDYLEQARHLARRERTRPKQASLRRAVSVAYYALFHLLCDEAASALVRGVRANSELKARTQGALEHGTMARVCRTFGSGALPTGLSFLQPVEPDLRSVAATFERAQTERHRADYDLQIQFTRSETLNFIGQIEAAFDAWNQVRESNAATYFLFALFFYRADRWRE